MECVILFRWDNGKVAFISRDDDDPAVFADIDAAIACTERHDLLKTGRDFQIVELNEL